MQHAALLVFAFAQIGQLDFMSSVVLPRTVVIAPPHAAHSCFDPIVTERSGILPDNALGRNSRITSVLQLTQTGLAAGVATGVAA